MNISTVNYTTLPLIIVLLITLIFWFFKYKFSYWKRRGLEYLEPSIPCGNIFDLAIGKVTLGELFAQQYLEIKGKGLKHAGSYCLWSPLYIPVDLDIIKRILISDFEYFPNHCFYFNGKSDPVTVNVFTMRNESWRNIRAKFPSAFTTAKMRNMFLVMERMTTQLAENLEVYANGKTPVDIKSEMARLTTDVICSCAFGIETNTMKNENEELLRHGKTYLSQFNKYRNAVILAIPHSILRKLNFRVLPKNLENFFFNLFQNVMSYKKDNNANRGDITDILLRLTEQHDDERDFSGKKPMEPLSFKEFASHAIFFFAAGFETSSSTQTWALYELAKNPSYQDKLRKEINDVLAKYDYKITYDAVMEMKYLEMVVDETLRLYTIFPILARICTKNYNVPGTNITIEKDTIVAISNMGIHRDPEFYPNPEKFDPERFSSENKAKRPFISYIPFGEGPRICIGKRFGLLQTKVGLISILRKYEVSLDKKTTESGKFVSSEIVLRKAGNVWLNLKKL